MRPCRRCQDLGDRDGAAGRGSMGKAASRWPSTRANGAVGRPESSTSTASRRETVQDIRGDVEAGRRAIRVVLVDEPSGWVAFFCTDIKASVAEILATVADRFALETTFRDCKEIVGAGQQQVRFVWANVGAFHICLWTFTMTEAWAWSRSEDELVDRRIAMGRSGPSPEPRGQASGVAAGVAGRGDSCGSTPGVTEEEIRAAAERLLALAA